jgi:prepilin-type N-terminal cleavage/methylation domain-containing protein
MKRLSKKEQGFTLIEIVIVLAIAGAIMLLVFLAVSGAQKTKRDTATKSAAGQLSAQIENYMSNHSGLAPVANTSIGVSYLGNIKSGQGNTPIQASAGNAATPANPIKYSGNMICTNPNGSGAFTGGTATQYAVSYYLESSNSNVCIDNQ